MRIGLRRYCFSGMSEKHLPRADHHEAMKRIWFLFLEKHCEMSIS